MDSKSKRREQNRKYSATEKGKAAQDAAKARHRAKQRMLRAFRADPLPAEKDSAHPLVERDFSNLPETDPVKIREQIRANLLRALALTEKMLRNEVSAMGERF